jgi:hypothetical protein
MRLHPIYGDYRLHRGTDTYPHPAGFNYACRVGRVIFAAYNGGAGNEVRVLADDGSIWKYFHNARFLVSVGQRVETGQALAVMGTTGDSTGIHCHLELWAGTAYSVDPMPAIAAEIASTAPAAPPSTTPFPTTRRIHDMPTVLYRDNDGLAFYVYTEKGAQSFGRAQLGDQQFNALFRAMDVYPRINFTSNPALWDAFDGGPLKPLLDFPLWKIGGTAAKPTLTPIIYGGSGGASGPSIDVDALVEQIVEGVDDALDDEVKSILDAIKANPEAVRSLFTAALAKV